MPRHNLKKYRPEDESSAGLKKQAKESGTLCINTNDRKEKSRKGETLPTCACGCGHDPVGEKRTFIMGHDARLRGMLIRAHLTGTEVARYRGGKLDGRPHTAAADAERWGQSFVDALKGAEARLKRVNKKVLDDALNSKRLVKVGRWKYTGQVVAVFKTKSGQEFDVKYVSKTGDVKTVRVRADQAPLANGASAEAGAEKATA